MRYEYRTVEQFLRALDVAVAETVADQGVDGDTVYADLVDSLMYDVSPSIRSECYRVTGCQPRTGGPL